MVAKETDDNLQLSTVLDVLALLVKYGYYDAPEDVDAVLKPLVEVMNGITDLPFREATSTNKHGGGGVIGSKWAVKTGGMEYAILWLTGLKEDFKNGGRYKESEDNKTVFTVKERALEVLDLLFNFRFYIRLQVSIT